MDLSNDHKRVVHVQERNRSSDRDTPTTEQVPNKGSKRRHATVYDAVAGKVSHDQGPSTEPEEAQYKHRHPKAIRYPTKDTPLAPDEVLFRRKDAPERYLEHDIYYAHERDLPYGGQGVLPDSDLLKAIHAYTSAFYSARNRERQPPDNRNVTDRSMDETALLAFGILLEEAGKDILGRRGDLVFTEGADDAPGDGFEPVHASQRHIGLVTREITSTAHLGALANRIIRVESHLRADLPSSAKPWFEDVEDQKEDMTIILVSNAQKTRYLMNRLEISTSFLFFGVACDRQPDYKQYFGLPGMEPDSWVTQMSSPPGFFNCCLVMKLPFSYQIFKILNPSTPLEFSLKSEEQLGGHHNGE
ncbi:membrane protein [Fusarium austroafricanum]|uniref:Membrane protein n=1 Tax=Fusarium austroafricanum TaxID=2364996 RepID=A0A8H4P5G5_9HYPO|nr:membrane protein [Fusarium austroafricanum]